MKVGDLCSYESGGRIYTGTITLIAERGHGVIIDLSDTSGIMMRWVDRRKLRVIYEEG